MPLSGVVVLLAGLGFLLGPAVPAAAQPPAQGWTTTQAPLPNDAGTDPRTYIATATCPAANACLMVGWYNDTGNRPWGMIEQQNGTTWTDTEAPEPSNHGTGGNQGLWLGSEQCGYILPCRAATCPSPGLCIAVGQYLDTAGFGQPVVETESNGTWTASEPPLPSDTATDVTPDHPDALLFSISCTSGTSCVAVGRYRNTSNHYVGLIETLAGTNWSAAAAPLPNGAGVMINSYPPTLTSVSCASSTVCTAVGSYLDGAGYTNGLIETLSGTSWTATTAAQPSNAGNDGDTDQNSLLSQVACPSASVCEAVGFYTDNTDVQRPLINSLNSGSWNAATAVPSNLGQGFTQLGAVSCPTPTFCVAVGVYTDTSDKQWGLIDTLSSGAWSATAAPQPTAVPEADQYALLWEVACPTPNFCLAPGQYENASTNYVATAVTYSAGVWSTAAASVPSNVGDDSYGRTVSCDSPVACVLGGQYQDTSANGQAFLDTWTGAQGYWLDASDGGIFTYPNNAFYGSTGALKLNKPMVGMAATPDAQGYWLVASDGGIFTYGDAQFYGSTGAIVLNKPVVGMATTPDGKGYWLVASDGGIFSYGDAGFFGSRGGQPINAPIVGMASTADGKGYWLVGSDGGIYSYGDALFYGSTGALKLNKPVVGMASTPTGLGYWLVASDGGIFNYGDANFYGSTGAIVLNKPVVGMAGSPSGKGYWLVASDGGIFNYGDAPFQGSAGALKLNAPVVGMAGG
jgi:hypothetical protein